MKKYLPIFAVLIVGGFALLVPASKPAEAFSLTAVSTYFNANSIYVDSNGDLNVSWQKVELGFGGYDLPTGDALLIMINGTSSLPTASIDGYNYSTSESPHCTASSNGTLNPIISFWNAPHCTYYSDPIPGNQFVNQSTNSYGNTATDNQVWDGAAGQFVAANTITYNTPIYAVLVSGLGYYTTTGGAYTNYYLNGTPTVVDSAKYTANALVHSLGAIISTPANNVTTSDFNTWAVSFSNTASTTATGTLYISYGLTNSSSSMATDSSTFTIYGNSTQVVDVPKTAALYYPQATGTLQYVASLGLSTAAESYSTTSISFGVNAQTGGGVCDQPESVNLTTPLPSSTITNDFQNWVISTPSLLEGCHYTLQVIALPQVGSLTSINDSATITPTPSYNPSQVSIVKSRDIWNYYNATTTQINYNVQLINKDDGIVIGSDSGAFYLGYSATSSPATAPVGFDPSQQCGGVCQGFGTIGGGSIATQTSTIAATGLQCIEPSSTLESFFSGADLGYGICATMNYLFVPNASTQSILAGDMNVLQTVPPFSWFFLTNAQIAADANTSVSVTPDLGVAITIQNNLAGATSSATIIPADWTSNSFLSDGRLVDDWYNFVLTACILVAVILLYKVAL